jgi:Domain of unknown function (DUF4307)
MLDNPASMGTEPDDLPDGRYGRALSPVRRRVGIAVLAVLVAAAVGWFAWASYSGRQSATGTDVGFVVVDDSTVRVTFDVTKPKDATARCTLEAMDSGFGVVGTVQVRVGPSDHGVVRQTATVRTTNRATTGRVTSCSVTH